MGLFISNVFKKLKNIICLINERGGGNDLVEDKRGKKHADMKFDFISNSIKIEKFNEEQHGDSDSDDELMQDV